jgi:hypothetical protein
MSRARKGRFIVQRAAAGGTGGGAGARFGKEVVGGRKGPGTWELEGVCVVCVCVFLLSQLFLAPPPLADKSESERACVKELAERKRQCK